MNKNIKVTQLLFLFIFTTTISTRPRYSIGYSVESTHWKAHLEIYQQFNLLTIRHTYYLYIDDKAQQVILLALSYFSFFI